MKNNTARGTSRDFKRISTILFILLALILLSSITASIKVATYISFQGKVANQTTGDAITPASMRINITELDDFDSVIWNSTFNDVVDSQGVFDLILGKNYTLNLTPGKDYQLVSMIDYGATSFVTADVIFGDNQPSGDEIIVNAGGPSDATELVMSDNISSVEAEFGNYTFKYGDIMKGSYNITDKLNVSKGLIVGDYKVNISLIGEINATRFRGLFVGDGSGLTGITATGINLNGSDLSIKYMNITTLNVTGTGTLDKVIVGLRKVNISSTGDVNATKFYGDGSGLTGVSGTDGTKIANGTDANLLYLRVSTLNVTGNSYLGDNVHIGSGGINVSGDINISGRLIVGSGTIDYATSSGDLYVSNNLEVDGNLYGASADVAELFETDDNLEPGDVVVIDLDSDEKIMLSSKPYQTTVAGIVSSDPSYILNAKIEGVPLALSGRVYVKVINENGAVQRGDLLTTSSTAGYAMRCPNGVECPVGTVLGKALEPFNEEKGMIKALVMLG